MKHVQADEQQKERNGALLLATCFMLVPYLAYSLTLKMETTYFSETSVDFQQTTWLYVPEERIFP
jgi:hypothetical protein